MEDSYMIGISSALPFSEAQYDGLMQIVDNMDNCYNALEVKIPNYADFDDFMAVYLKWRDYGFHVELDFPMEDFGWQYPLVLAAGLGAKRTKRLLRDLLVDLTGTGEHDLVQTRFRRVPALRYGEKKAEEVRKDAAADWGKEN